MHTYTHSFYQVGRLTAHVGTETQARKNAERQLADHKAQFDRDLAAQLAQFRLLEERAKELEAKLSDATAELGEERQSRQKVERELADEKARFERDLDRSRVFTGSSRDGKKRGKLCSIPALKTSSGAW